MDRITINVKTEDVYRSRAKRSPIKRSEVLNASRLICSASMLLTSYEEALSELLVSQNSTPHRLEIATTIKSSVESLNDQVFRIKDSMSKYLAADSSLIETQSGYIREALDSFNRYMDTFDIENLLESSEYLADEFKTSPITTGLSEHVNSNISLNGSDVLPKATSILKGVLHRYEDSSL